MNVMYGAYILCTTQSTTYVLSMYIKLGTAISHLFCLKMSTTELCATSQLPPTNWVSIAKYYCRYISYFNKGKSLQEFQYKQ